MNESVGNALLFNLVISIVVILLAFFIGSLSYSKASKVKNKIIEELEKQGEYAASSDSSIKAKDIYDNSVDEIEKWLGSTNIGYRQNGNPGMVNQLCESNKPEGATLVNESSDYEYCVYAFSTCHENNNGVNQRCGIYFKVRTYMYFDVPVIQDLIKIPIDGETMTFSKIKS